ncbi:MAG: hypothetical protein PVJ95_06690 [Cellvibrionales bacterium]|jgi:MFS family permease
MLKSLPGNRNPVDCDSRPTLFTAFLIGVIAPEVFIVQPGFVQGLVEYLEFTDAQAGYVASAEMFGLAGTTILMSFVAQRLNWRHVIMVSLLLMFMANALSTVVTSLEAFATLRFMAGLGGGSLVSLGFAIVGMSSNPDRNFGLMIMWVLTYGALGLFVMPEAYALTDSMNAVLWFFALFPLLALPFVRHLPSTGETDQQGSAMAMPTSTGVKALAIFAMLAYFTAQGIVWAYLFLIGLSGGLDEQAVANGLTLSQFAGIAGALLAALMGSRYGRVIPLMLGIVGGAACLYFLVGEFSFLVFAAAVCVYNFAWNVVHPFLLAAMADFDARGRVVVYAVAMQMIGLAFGPGLAASMLDEGSLVTVNLLGAFCFLLSALLILPPLLKQRRSLQP